MEVHEALETVTKALGEIAAKRGVHIFLQECMDTIKKALEDAKKESEEESQASDDPV